MNLRTLTPDQLFSSFGGAKLFPKSGFVIIEHEPFTHEILHIGAATGPAHREIAPGITAGSCIVVIDLDAPPKSCGYSDIEQIRAYAWCDVEAANPEPVFD